VISNQLEQPLNHCIAAHRVVSEIFGFVLGLQDLSSGEVRGAAAKPHQLYCHD
jgi:hypothetical protein